MDMLLSASEVFFGALAIVVLVVCVSMLIGVDDDEGE